MADTKENIMLTALRLFAQNGYEAVSVSDIAGELGMAKSALYKHYRNKRAIFESILTRMEALDAESAKEHALPEGTLNEMEEAYRHASLQQVVAFGREQFRRWTAEEFHASFRKMLTLEQYRSDEMRALYQQYLAAGPLGYVRDLFCALGMENAAQKAIAFYAPMFLFYSMADGAADRSAVTEILNQHLDCLYREWAAEQGTADKMQPMNNNNSEGTAMKDKDYIIRRETPDDYAEVENLVREAFWNVYRPGCIEHYALHIMRESENFVKELDFVMEKDAKLIGQVVYTRAAIQADDGRTIPVMTMGPIGILPEYKRQGYGKALLDYSMEEAARMGAGALCFEGNIDFYGKCGFVVASTMGIHYHGEPRENEVPYFLCKELTPGYLAGVEGVFVQPLADFIDEAATEAFDQQFPYKEKLKLPGQLV